MAGVAVGWLVPRPIPSDSPASASASGSSSSAPSTVDLPIQEATLELIRWFIPFLRRLPRLHRQGLGDRLVANLSELLGQLALARFQRERLAILQPLRGRIQLIQLQTRRLHDFQLIDLRHCEHASRLITAIGRHRLPRHPLAARSDPDQWRHGRPRAGCLPRRQPAHALQRRRGLPIGNLTSQFLANLHLNALDHSLSALPGVRAYLLYVDDLALFADHPEPLRRARGRLRVRNHNLRRGRRRLRLQHRAVLAGVLPATAARISLLSWNAHLAHGHTWRLRRRLFADLAYAASIPCSQMGRAAAARRLLEQQPQELPFGHPQPQPARQCQQQRWLPWGLPPPAPFIDRAAGRDSSGKSGRVTDPRVQTRSRDRRPRLCRPTPAWPPLDPHSAGGRPAHPRLCHRRRIPRPSFRCSHDRHARHRLSHRHLVAAPAAAGAGVSGGVLAGATAAVSPFEQLIDEADDFDAFFAEGDALIVEPLALTMLWIPPGRFWMGSPPQGRSGAIPRVPSSWCSFQDSS